MKGHFDSEHIRFNDIQKEALRKKEMEMVDELQAMKKDKEIVRMKTENDEKVLLDLVNELKYRKDRELRARIEKEDIQK